MLVLSRRINESIVINGDILITVLEVGRNGQVRLGIDAPRHYQVYRRELWLEIEQENRLALASALDPNANTVAPNVPNHVDHKLKSPATSEPTPTDPQPVNR
jgi:carbon storage regulator